MKIKKVKPLFALLRFIYNITIRNVLIYLPRTVAHKIIYYTAFGQKLDLKHPIDLNQKIHYLVVYKYGDLEAKLLDKYAVKEYVNGLGIKDLHTAKLYALYNDVNEIDLDKLPNIFVMKTTHGCGDIVVCLDKVTFDLDSAKKKLRKALKYNLSKQVCEYFSVNVTKAIVCEEYIDDGKGISPTDYKFWCFHGKAICVMVCTERNVKTRYDFFDMDWNYLDWSLDELKSKDTLQKPENLSRFKEIAEELAAPFPFVRVDLYNAKGKVYFGEYTFTPFDGNIRVLKQPILKALGALLKLNKYE